MAAELKKVKLTSSEGTEFIIDRKVAEKSVLLKNMLEDVGESDMGKNFIWCLSLNHVGNSFT
ncbi:23288_t:CDS:1, partial [Gigaspora rosea]